MSRICTICARSGSKGVPDKNLRPLLGRPLVVHSVAQARGSGLFDEVVVSSDSAEILAAAADGSPDVLSIRRPQELASDDAAKIPAIQHAVSQVEEARGRRFDVVVDLDATSPLRTLDDIKAAVGLLETSGAGNVITATPARHSPYFNLIELDDRGVPRLVCGDGSVLVRRQQAPECYDMNASIYVWRRDALFAHTMLFNDDTRLYVMPRDRSIDIDDPVDLLVVERLAELRGELA